MTLPMMEIVISSLVQCKRIFISSKFIKKVRKTGRSSTYHSSSGSCSIFPADRAPNSFMDNLYMAFDHFESANFCLFLDTLFFLMLVCMQRLYIFVNKVILMEKNLLFRVQLRKRIGPLVSSNS